MRSVVKPFTKYKNIPNIIFRTHKTLSVPISMVENCHYKWVKLNPKHSIFWFSNSDCDNFMKNMGERIYKCYDSLIPGAYKCDLWRACILYKFGGVYVDSYAKPYVSIREMCKRTISKNKEHQFISVLDNCGIHNGFIMCTPRHPFIKQYIKDMLCNIENKYYGKHDLDITGPKCLARSISKVLKVKEN